MKDLSAPYQPHESVIALPIYQSNPTLRRIIDENSVVQMAEDIRGWKGAFSSFHYKTMMATVEWDLRTHYGLGDDLLGKPEE